jgi:hypothetical protein
LDDYITPYRGQKSGEVNPLYREKRDRYIKDTKVEGWRLNAK